jgi:hypothetical protein
MGFGKAFNFTGMSLTADISKPLGILWLIAAVLFVISSFLFIIRSDYWWALSAPAVIISQILIILSWKDAKFGTIANLIMIFPLIIAFMNSLPSSFKNSYIADAKERIKSSYNLPLVTENDIQSLPFPVQKYLRYTQAIGKPRVINFRAEYKGKIKPRPDGDWLEFHSQQYNFFDDFARLFYIQSKMYGIPFDGYHSFIGKNAVMLIKIASLFKVADARGEKMNQGETVTLFNDICIMSPAFLIDPSIKWEAVDSLSAKARFTNKGITISATLFFNEKGELINFSSDDRFMSADGKEYMSYRWTTPASDYVEYAGRRLPSKGILLWHTPKGEFQYGEFNLVNIEYNCTSFKYTEPDN